MRPQSQRWLIPIDQQCPSRGPNRDNSTFSPDANGVGADAGETWIARTPLALWLNVSLNVARGNSLVEGMRVDAVPAVLSVLCRARLWLAAMDWRINRWPRSPKS